MAKRTITVDLKIDTSDINQKFWQVWVDATEFVITREFDKIQAHYLDDLPNECVGLVWNDGLIQRLRNQASSPHRFSISKPQITEKIAEREEEEEDVYLMAIYHSHPEGSTTLSWADKRSFIGQHENDLRIPWLVVVKGSACLWYMQKEEGVDTNEMAHFHIEPSPESLDEIKSKATEHLLEMETSPKWTSP